MKRILAALLLLTLAAPAWGQDYEKGQNAYERGDYAAALRELRPLAEQGHAEAQFKLGVMYFNGWGVAQDLDEAWKWWGKAEEQGHAGAKDVSGLLVEGLNSAGAVEWYRKAAEQGDADSQYNLGFLYASGGRSLAQDYAEAVKWFRLAAEQGESRSQFKLGIMYANGQGMPQDYAEAHKWLNLSAAEGGAASGTAAELRDRVASEMTPAQIAEAQRLAREWMAAFEKRKKK